MIELLIVIALIAILSVVVILTLNPAQLIASSRDSNRVSDMATMTSAIGLYLAEGGTVLGSSNIVYVSIPDPTATSSLGDQCQGLNLLTLPSGYTYHCAASSTFRNVNGQGWIPINFSTLPAGSPLSNLPVDPTNQSSSRLYYTYDTNGSQYEVTSVMESQKYQLGGSNDVIANDGGTLASVYEKGSAFGLEPLDYGDSSLVGYWPLTEGTGTIAYDYSGNNATGSWNGTQIGTNGYYSTNAKVGPYSGDFDGSSTYIKGSMVALPIGSSARTVSEWFELTSRSGAGGLATYGVSCNWFGAYVVNITPYHLNFWGCGGNDYDTGYAINLNAWYDLTEEYNGAATFIYVNSTLVASETEALNTGVGNLFIGASPIVNDYFPGLIDDVRIYNRALTAAQIAAMYAGGK